MRVAKLAGWAAGLGLAAVIVVGGVAVKGVCCFLRSRLSSASLTFPSSTRERPRLAALAAAVGQQRPIEARASGGFAWAPFASPVRANLPAQVRSSEWQSRAAVLAAADAVRRDALNAPDDALALADLGVAHLVTGAPAKAADVLEEARDRAPSDARILTDLAAAYLARGQANEKAEDLARAADAAERATRLDAARLEAWFNRAVALQKLRLDEAARAAWREYLRRDAASAWAEEARTRLATLERHQPPVSRNELEAVLAGDLSPPSSRASN